MAEELVLRCPDHPSYRAIRKPTGRCRACTRLYELESAAREQEAAGGAQA